MSKVFTQQEQQDILTALVGFVNECPSLNGVRVILDDFEDVSPALCIGTSAGGNKKFNVIGGYEADFPFYMYVKVKQTLFPRKKIDSIKILTDVGIFFEERTGSKELPKWSDRDVCLKIEMIGYPYLFDKEEKDQDSLYQISCSMTYRHKSKYE